MLFRSKPMDGMHEHAATPKKATTPAEGELPQPSDDGVGGLDDFELGMRKAAAAKTKTAPKRKPAAASASLKRPASAGASTGSESKKPVAGASTPKPRKPVPGWGIARRLKTYPNGCSKCAHKVPGCTLSCFRARGEV